MTRFARLALGIAWLILLTVTPVGLAAEAVPPNFQEIYQLIRSNLAGAKPEELDRASATGLLQQLHPRVLLTPKPPVASATGAAVAFKTHTFEDLYAYVRPGTVASNQVEQVQAAVEKLGADKKLKGLVLDLRFARSQDYAAAAALAGQFVPLEKARIDVGGVTLAASAKSPSLTVPLAVLINHETAGAAEALAALLRQNKAALLLGGATAGEAFAYKEFPLSNGARLQIATSSVKLGDGQLVPAQGVKPDIAVTASAADERAWLADPFKELGTTSALTGASTGTNAPRRRINEAELVRRQREGQNPDEDAPVSRSREPEAVKPLVRDAALARALDLLKGLAVVRQFRAP